ncbi:MAG: sodium:proton exchanger [Bacteroidetes bacterium]|jgi:CPA2 family monovalent cation:H+ antiporter-2|nr:sodium:proton exchanger [Bacteroidota bacterium]
MELDILRDIVIIFALSTLVNFIFTKIKVPTIIGYLLTGIVAGPYLFGIIHAPHQIELMAEIGVILLMFTIGLEFSLKHLLRIRRIVFLGGFLQLILTAFITLFIAKGYGMEWKNALFMGFITALSSTAVVLKLLQERSEITSNYGRTVLGILIFQDVILVPLLLFTPILGGESADMASEFLWLGVKAIGIMGFVYVGNKWLMPKLLHWIALTKNQELFLMSILLICLSVALLTSKLGMSLAFGAFLAGLMISESNYSHNAFGHLIPFKDTFTSFFFVSIGLLLDVSYVIDNWLLVLSTVAIVLVVKTIIAGGTAFILGHTFKGTMMVGLALSQVGEFSFILAKLGVDYNLLSGHFYQLFLAVAIITMSLSPFLITVAPRVANLFLRLPLPQSVVEGLFPLKQVEIPIMKNHLVLIGKDSRALNLSRMAQHIKLPHASIVFDPALARKRQEQGDTVVYGDAVNEPILEKAHVEHAETVVISIGDLITAMAVVEKVRLMNKHAFIIVRTKHVHEINELYKLGANQVIPEEFETAIDLFERVLKKLLLPKGEIERIAAHIRDDHYGIFREEIEKSSDDVFNELPNIDISAVRIEDQSFLIEKTLREMNFRKTFGVTLVAVKRDDRIIEHPDSRMKFKQGDVAYILGKPDQIANATELFSRAEIEN